MSPVRNRPVTKLASDFVWQHGRVPKCRQVGGRRPHQAGSVSASHLERSREKSQSPAHIPRSPNAGVVAARTVQDHLLAFGKEDGRSRGPLAPPPARFACVGDGTVDRPSGSAHHDVRIYLCRAPGGPRPAGTPMILAKSGPDDLTSFLTSFGADNRGRPWTTESHLSSRIVFSVGFGWCPQRDSNPRPFD